MHRLTVLYGHPKDPAEFDRNYQEVHIPIAQRMMGSRAGSSASASPLSRQKRLLTT
jgi:uncharacterized protein (TIGR02118 family)